MVVLHPAHLVGVDAVTFVASALLTRAILLPLSAPRSARRHREDPPSLGEDIREGLRFLWRHLIVRTMTLLGSLVAFAGGAFVGLFVVWADRVLDVREGDPRLGVLFGTWGVGAIAGSAALPRLVRRLGNARAALALLPLSAALLVTTSLMTAWWLAALCLAAWATAYSAFVVNAVTVRQLLTPATLQSRVNATGRMLTYGLGYPVGAALAGVLAEVLSVRGALLATASPVVIAAGLAWRSPLRGADVESAAAALSRAEAGA
jgi:predicted MFS family arabinose efflux permease